MIKQQIPSSQIKAIPHKIISPKKIHNQNKNKLCWRNNNKLFNIELFFLIAIFFSVFLLWEKIKVEGEREYFKQSLRIKEENFLLLCTLRDIFPLKWNLCKFMWHRGLVDIWVCFSFARKEKYGKVWELKNVRKLWSV